MPSSGMYCSSIKNFWASVLNQHHQTKILDVLIFLELVANKGHFWSETTVTFFKKKTAKDVHSGNVKIKWEKNQICEKCT